MGEIDTLNIRRNFSNNFNNENISDDHFNEIASVIKNKMTISPKERTELSNKAKLELILKSDPNNKDISNSLIDIPQIRKPNSSLSGKGNLLFILAEMQKITVDLQGENLKLRIELFNVKLKAKTENANQLSSEIDQFNHEYQQQLAYLNSMTMKLQETKSCKQELENELHALKNELNNKHLGYKNLTENIKENLTENSLLLEKKLAEEINTLTNFIQQKESELIELNNLFVMRSNECETAINNVAQCADLLDDALNKLREFKVYEIESHKPIEHHIEEALSNTAKLLEILTTLIITIGNSAVDKLQDDLEINRKRATANQNELKRKSEEYEQQVQKAEETQKIAKCVGQILGGLVMAIGAVGALFGGAGIALMAVGIGLLAVDFIAEKATGRSLTDRIMSPLMEHVFMPLMEIIGKVVDAILEYTPLGSLLKEIDKAAGTDLLSIAKGIATAAVAVAAMIALAYVAKSAAKFLFEKMSQTFINSIMQVAKQAITQVIKKIIPNAVRNMSNQTSAVVKKIINEITKKLEQVASKISTMMEKATQHVNKSVFKNMKLSTPEEIHRLMRITGNRLAMANQAIMFSNTATQGGLRINVANAELQKANINANMLLERYEIDRLMDDSQHLFTIYKHLQEGIMKLFSDIAEIITAQNDTGKHISKSLRA
ncbi:type III secretion system translocon subunit SctE [Arsenophonus apicola]|uniref:Type III secretion system translocon subunit SctE n=1 Tax=Arsenophonus apicola TaxID=2879119 RepID=A0ABY8P0F8_9GAMM|nr:type III secretion system translocon subunit SctE [Arsenophonus apicola]WGO82963.1 type III secretion system translocon subunit SctE [Arsenophonus apicola]